MITILGIVDRGKPQPQQKCPLCGGELVLQEAWDWLDRWTDVVKSVNIRKCLECGAEEGYWGYWILPDGRVVKPAKQRKETA